MTDIPGNGSLFMQSVIKRLTQLLESDEYHKSIVNKVIKDSGLNDKHIQICSMKNCMQLCKVSGKDIWTGRGCCYCGNFFCTKYHKHLYNEFACMKCWDQYCAKCRTVSECNLCEEEASEDDSEYLNYYCNVCLPDHKKTHKNPQKPTKTHKKMNSRLFNIKWMI